MLIKTYANVQTTTITATTITTTTTAAIKLVDEFGKHLNKKL